MDAIYIAEHQFKQEVIDSDRLVLVDFYTDWCMPCKTLSPLLDKMAHQFAKEIRVVKINADDEQRLATVYKVRSVPTVLFFKLGKVVDTIVGVSNENAYMNAIRKQLR